MKKKKKKKSLAVSLAVFQIFKDFHRTLKFLAYIHSLKPLSSTPITFPKDPFGNQMKT